LETPEAEDDIAFTAKPIEELEAARHWGTRSESDEVEEEEGEESSGHGGWRPDGLEEPRNRLRRHRAMRRHRIGEMRRFMAVTGERRCGHKWAPVEATPVEEVAEAPRVGVSTVENKPQGAPAPFAGDAWAAALATTVQEKIVGASEQAMEVSAPADANATVIEPVANKTEAAGPANWRA